MTLTSVAYDETIRMARWRAPSAGISAGKVDQLAQVNRRSVPFSGTQMRLAVVSRTSTEITCGCLGVTLPKRSTAQPLYPSP